MSRTMLLLCLLAPLLMSCAATGPNSSPVADCTPETKIVTQTKIVDTGCDWNSPIYVSKTEILSNSLADLILSHNRTGAAKCGWKPNK